MPNLPRLPDYVPGRPVQGGSGRISARAANDLERAPRERALTIGAAGKLLPVAFGRRDLPGRIFAWAVHDGDLYVGVLWCIGECGEIEAVYIDDEALPGSGVTVTHYLGTDSQGVDPSLSAAIAAYNDTMRVNVDGTWVGICYSVFVIGPTVLDGFPRSFRAVGKWRKVWDPRTSTRVFSENAALIGRELITDPIIGLGLPVTGDIACADWADTLLGDTIPRGRVSFVMDSARDLYRSWLPLIAEYGEFFYDLSGAGINMTPDAPSWFVPEREPEQVEELVSGSHGTNGGGVFKGSAGRHGLSFAAADYVLSDFSISATSWLVEARLLWNKVTSPSVYLYDQPDRTLVELNGFGGPATGNIQFWDGAWHASDVPARDGVWCLYSFHYRADGTVDVYLDGVHEGSASGVTVKDWADLRLMIRFTMDINGAAGIMSEFRIWDVGGMTTGQVADHVAQYAETERLNGDESGLRIYYPMNDIPVIKAHDVISQPDGRSGMTLVAEPGSDTPTVVEVRYTVPATDGKPWGTATEPRQLPGVESGEVPRIPTSVGLEGVFRAPDAANRALARLNRLRNRINITWQTRDYGIEHHRGRVVEIQRPDIGIETYARVMQVDYAGPGRYQVIAQRYSDDQHPSELQLPEDTTTVPVGAITILSGGSVPDGWAAYTAADGRYIRGANYTTLNPGATGGSLSVQFSGNTTSDGAHPPSGWARFPMPGDSDHGSTNTNRWDDAGDDAGDHHHTYDTGSLSIRPATRQERLIQKTGTPGLSVPAAARVFGLGGLSHPDIQRLTSLAGRIIEADTAAANAGAAQHAGSVSTSTATWGHRHVSSQTTTVGVYFSEQVFNSDTVGNHPHTLNYTITPSPARRRLALYGGVTDFAVMPGMAFLWEGTVANLPADWYLCDGANGTPDCTELFIEIAGDGQEGTSAGDNTVAFSATTNSFSHNHKGSSSIIDDRPVVQRSHENNITHSHTASGSDSYLPPYYVLAVVMYLPGQ